MQVTSATRAGSVSLFKEHGIDPDRITTIDGGYRSTRAVEMYVLPKGGAIPVPFLRFVRVASRS